MIHTQRITISLPKPVYQLLTQKVQKGQISRFISHIIERELTVLPTDPVRAFIDLKKHLPKKSDSKIITAIKKGRV